MKCEKCGFELDNKDSFCPKCGEKVKKNNTVLCMCIIAGITIIVLIVLSIILIKLKSKDDDSEYAQPNNSEESFIEFESGTEKPLEEKQVSVKNQKEELSLDEDDFIDKGPYFDSKGFFGITFDNNIMGMDINDFYDYVGVESSFFSEKSSLGEESAVYVIDKDYSEIELNGIQLMESSCIYTKDDAIVALGLNLSFEDLSEDKGPINSIFNAFLDEIPKSGGEGDFYVCNLGKITSVEEYYGALCWNNDVTSILLSAGEGHIDIKYGSDAFLSKSADDEFAGFFKSEYEQQEKQIAWVNEDGYRPKYVNEILDSYEFCVLTVTNDCVIAPSKSYLYWDNAESREVELYYYDATGAITKEYTYEKVVDKEFGKNKCHELRLDAAGGENEFGLGSWDADFYYTDNYIVIEYTKLYLENNQINQPGAVVNVIEKWQNMGWSMVKL